MVVGVCGSCWPYLFLDGRAVASEAYLDMPRHALLVMTGLSQAGRVGITAQALISRRRECDSILLVGSIVVMRDHGFDRTRSTRPLFGGSLLDSLMAGPGYDSITDLLRR